MSFISLPNEVWQIVFSQGLRRGDVRSVCLVSRRFYELANTAEVWRAAMNEEGYTFAVASLPNGNVYTYFHPPTLRSLFSGPSVSLSRYGAYYVSVWKQYNTVTRTGNAIGSRIVYQTSFTGSGALIAEYVPKRGPTPGFGKVAHLRRKWALRKRFHVVHAHRLGRGLLSMAKREFPDKVPYSIPARVDNEQDFHIL